jgi:tetratricopeptide (TPR) repeat protein
MHIPALAILVVTLLAIITGHWRFATERFWVKPGIVGRLLATLLCLAAIGWMGSQIARLFPEQQALMKIGERENLKARDFVTLKNAYAAEPKNSQTPYKIGEFLRKQAWPGVGDSEKKMNEAITWFEKSMALNPLDPHGFIGKGLCLDWMGQTDEGGKFFKRAIELDPDSYYTRAHYGWHFYQLRDYENAIYWFQTSLGMRPGNPIAKPYLELITRRMEAEAAAKAKGTAIIPEPKK